MEALGNSSIAVNGETISYLQVNKTASEVVLMVHGNLSCKGWWRETIQELGDLFRIIAVDLRGYGDSTYNKPVSTLEELAGDLKSFCTALELAEFTVVGWSLGGLVAMKLAELMPQQVKKVVLTCSVGHHGLYQSNPATGQPIDTLEKIKDHEKYQFMNGWIEQKNAIMMRGVFESVLLKYAQHLSLERKIELSSSAFKQRHYYQSLAIVAHPGLKLDKTGAKKWLVVAGKQDTITPYEGIQPTVKQLTKLGRQVVVHQLDNAGHMVPLEHTNEYAALLKKFIEEQ